jgi:peptidoglycan/xylan/chitin deacetylase (PgdA/CDA1 family)
MFEALGILRGLECMTVARGCSLVILTYHRIATPGVSSNPYYDQVISATPEQFRAQIRYLTSHFRLTQPQDILAPGTGPSPTLRGATPSLLVTFDDGYRDNYETAAPILREFGVPATFFVTPGFIERPRLPWWDHVAYVIKRTATPRFELQRYPGDSEPILIDLGTNPTDQQRNLMIAQIIFQFVNNLIRDEDWFLTQLDHHAEVAIDQDMAGRALIMGWAELRQLVDAGMTVGSHGLDHRALGRLAEEDQIHELTHSKQMIECALQREVIALAYPFGWPGTFTRRTQELAAQVGYKVAFSSLEGINNPDARGFEPFCLRRLNVGTGDSPPLLRARSVLHAALGRSFL